MPTRIMTALHITQHGRGKPLVLFHGWGFDSQIWMSLLPELIDRYRVYLVDLPGFGRSPYLAWDDFKLNLLMQLPQQFAVIGWSMGGLLATRLSIEAPERVTQLMNVASSPRFVETTNWAGIESASFDAFYDQLRIDPDQTRRHFIKAQLQDLPISPTWFTEPPSELGLRQGLDWLLTWDLRPLLSQLRLPVCYVFGRLDAIVSRHTMSAMQMSYPDFSYQMIRKSAHAPFLSHQDEFLTILYEFI